MRAGRVRLGLRARGKRGDMRETGMYANPVGDEERSGVVNKALMALGLLTVAVIAMAVMAMAGPAQAQSTTNPITVDSGGDTITDDEKCTLREAITNANDNKATSADCAAGSSTGEDTITSSG